MFIDNELQEHLKTKNTIEVEPFIIAEWNLNDFDNIKTFGNYRYRLNDPQGSIYTTLPNSYDELDNGDYYTDALISSIESEKLIDENDASLIFSTPEVDRQLYFDLKQCFFPFRPRSGINKPLYFDNGKFVDNIKSARRPRYYMASRYDTFKYWNSFRIENGIERGVSLQLDQTSIGYKISDSCPFVIYNNPVPTNRIVLKMQTNLAELEGSLIKDKDNNIQLDPLGNRDRSSIPKRWSIQYLDDFNNWVDAISFNEDSLRRDGSDIVKWDGYLELFYGVEIPEKYKGNFYYVDKLSDISQRPISGVITGEAYLLDADNENSGNIHIWDAQDQEWKIFQANYRFQLLEDDDTQRIGVINKLTDPDYFISGGNTIYRDVAFIKGLRLKIETLYGPDNTFDLIELSPRLKANISDYVLGFSFTKLIPNDVTGIPVGGLVASNGSMTMMNYDFAFSEQNIFINNQGSLIAKLLNPNTRVDFYEVVKNVGGFDKFIPLKSMYVEEFPNMGSGLINVDVNLRDNFFRFENESSPALFFQNVSLSFAISVLLDNIGFSNYIFKNIQEKNDPVIPYLFVEPEASVIEVLNRISIATQTAMFFDEYNNFVVMSKEYLLPDSADRDEDLTLYGQKEGESLPNIIEVKSAETKVLNDGIINYVSRYVQRAPASLQQAMYVDEDRNYGYQPVVLWEVPGQVSYKTINEKAKTNNFALGAVALNSDLNNLDPFVQNGEVVNNIIDIGENVYWLPRPQGFLYANGEIIKYDAVEYSVAGVGNVYITNEIDYQKYFSELPFNGKMYPTGLIRIYSEPFYEDSITANNIYVTTLKEGAVKKSGRAQFGTPITSHFAGIDSFWTQKQNLDGYTMSSSFLFTTTPTSRIVRPPKGTSSTKGWTSGKTQSQDSSRSSIIANFLRENIPSDDIVKDLRTTLKGTVQSSALTFTGPKGATKNLISHVKKTIDEDYRHFGTRMRIVGKKESSERLQTPTNATEYYITTSPTGEQSTAISGGSGGIAIMLDPEGINGYYFEICSLTADNLENYNLVDQDTGEEFSVLHNVLFYKVERHIENNTETAVPVKLYGGLAKILVDEGKFVGQDRLVNEDNPTVYDLAIEYKDIGTVRRFYLYLNGTQIATVDDTSPLQKKYNTMGLFIRGGSKCMFENVYALKNQYSQNSSETVIEQVSPTFGKKQINSSDALKKYAISGFVQATYLSEVGAQNAPKYKMYYEEFGTIMRECAYFNIKYDKAYPAFRAILKPTFGNEKAYTTSGFYSDPYGAEFLIFNATDKLIVLDETSGNYLKVIGITFTQTTSNSLSIDKHLQERSNFSESNLVSNLINSPLRKEKILQSVKNSRFKYGRREFVLESLYIQSEDQANNLMEWLIPRTLRPRKIVLLQVFGLSHLQLGDIVKIDYTLPSNDKFVDIDSKFVVSQVDYGFDQSGPSSVIKVVEV